MTRSNATLKFQSAVKSCHFCASVFVILWLTGCAQTKIDPAQEFASESIRITLQFDRAGRKFGQAMGTWLEGGNLEIDQAKRSLESIQDVATKAKTEFNRVPVPDTVECQNFAQTVMEYLDFQEAVVADLDKLITFAADNNPASFETREQWFMQLTSLNEKELAWKEKLMSGGTSLGLQFTDNSDTQ